MVLIYDRTTEQVKLGYSTKYLSCTGQLVLRISQPNPIVSQVLALVGKEHNDIA